MCQTLTWLTTLSVIPHNKLQERAFGMLDFMVRHRPNATILTNEAFVTRKQGREAKQKFKDRCLEIERKRFDALNEKR